MLIFLPNISPSCLPHLLQSNLPFHSKHGNCLHLALHPSGIIINSLRISLYLLIEELKDLLYKSFKLYWKSQVFNLSFSSFQVLCLDINLDRKGLRGSFRIFKKKTNILRIFIAKLWPNSIQFLSSWLGWVSTNGQFNPPRKKFLH